MRCQTESWERLTNDGLCASRVAVDAIDEDEELPKQQNHPRRIAFMTDLIAALPDDCFAPATRTQINAAVSVATAYWNKQATDEQRQQTHNELRDLLGKKNNSEWDLHSLPLWILQTEPFFSWMWYQWFDCLWCCIPDDMMLGIDLTFTALLQRHFSAEIQAWAANDKLI